MSAFLSSAAVAAPLAAGWSVHTMWLRHRLQAARRDPLTGLRVRDTFEKEARKLLSTGPRAVVVIDLDGFKQLNDTHGHAAGDAALDAIGRRLSQWAAGNAGVVARLGGDEFAAIVGVHSQADLAGELDRLHERLCEPVAFEGRRLPLGASIGAMWSGSALSGHALPALMRRADEAMYDAKRTGGGWLTALGAEAVHDTVNGRRSGRGGTHLLSDSEGGTP